MNNIFTTISISVLSISMMISCQKNENSNSGNDVDIPNIEQEPGNLEKAPITLNAAQTKINDRVAEFSLGLFNKMAELEKNDENILISPFSIDAALSMTLQGAAGETLLQMKQALEFEGMSEEEICEYFKLMVAGLRKSDASSTLSIANSIWYDPLISLKDGFYEKMTNYYDSECYPCVSPNVINKWVDIRTMGMIPNIIDENADFVVALINALYFKSSWTVNFEKTGMKTFTTSKSRQVSVPFMKKTDYGKVLICEDFSSVSVPYGNGAFAMTLISPKKATAADFAATLDAEKWNQIKYAPETEYTLTMPIFEASYSTTEAVKEALQEMGMTDAFELNRADFSELTERKDLYISKIVHKTKLIVNESGSEGATATDVEMTDGAAFPPLSINLNKPFIYAISEYSTGAMLFIGVLNTIE